VTLRFGLLLILSTLAASTGSMSSTVFIVTGSRAALSMLAVIYVTEIEARFFEAANTQSLSETPAGFDGTLNQDQTLTY
jgi:hypothetical protein